ncbi:heme-binding-like protein At3g10130, chloroplastic isoform X2 [Nicotiana tabacum]|uniref:Heme-binding-like protein At3g10130, chloroplastic isoform X2 n=2 Tax=Nicotiana TaxID=4085 RepID=A0AC58UKU3_TOBAC|nr:PREDICTED: heme-binding-like protein At3g10130, chloroplastic isoform X1 [Nicotiana sylvestris]
MLLCSPSSISAHNLSRNRTRPSPINSMAVDRSSSRVATTAPQRRNGTSALEARISLVIALASQTSSLSQKLLTELAGETAKYVFSKRIFENRTLEEALMSVPDLETVKFNVLKRSDLYEIRQVELRDCPLCLSKVSVNGWRPYFPIQWGFAHDRPFMRGSDAGPLQPYFAAEATMLGKYGFDFNGASQSFNTLAEYLFGKNTKKESMAMTTPVITRRTQSDGEKMEMTTSVITKRVEDQGKWRMSFVMPSKYGSDLPLPKDSSVTIKEVPRKTVAVVAFSGFVTDEEVKARESRLCAALKGDAEFRVKDGASIEVAQYNPPFTLPFTRRNEISLEVERKQE